MVANKRQGQRRTALQRPAVDGKRRREWRRPRRNLRWCHHLRKRLGIGWCRNEAGGGDGTRWHVVKTALQAQMDAIEGWGMRGVILRTHRAQQRRRRWSNERDRELGDGGGDWRRYSEGEDSRTGEAVAACLLVPGILFYMAHTGAESWILELGRPSMAAATWEDAD